MNLIERLRREADADLFGETVCAEAADRIEELEVELVDFKDSHADEWIKRKELEEDVAFYKARLDAVENRTCEWERDSSRPDRMYWGKCGAFFALTDDMHYCPQCGGKITQALEQKDETN